LTSYPVQHTTNLLYIEIGTSFPLTVFNKPATTPMPNTIGILPVSISTQGRERNSPSLRSLRSFAAKVWV
jgi:hypothetical protein